MGQCTSSCAKPLTGTSHKLAFFGHADVSEASALRERSCGLHVRLGDTSDLRIDVSKAHPNPARLDAIRAGLHKPLSVKRASLANQPR